MAGGAGVDLRCAAAFPVDFCAAEDGFLRAPAVLFEAVLLEAVPLAGALF